MAPTRSELSEFMGLSVALSFSFPDFVADSDFAKSNGFEGSILKPCFHATVFFVLGQRYGDSSRHCPIIDRLGNSQNLLVLMEYEKQCQ